MLTPAEVLHALAGSPPAPPAEDREEQCAICAQVRPRTAEYEAWLGATYTDQNKVKAWGARAICEPCIWAHSWVAPPGYRPTAEDQEKKAAKRSARAAAGEKVGNERTVNIRLFSHLWDEHGGYVYANKGSKATIRDWLRVPKAGQWFAAIADSGQKHVLPWTPMNLGSPGVVLFETMPVTIGDWALVDSMTALLTDGPTKEEISRGEYRRASWVSSFELVQAFEEQWGRRLRGSGWWDLALWLSQREEAEHERRADERRDAKRLAGARRQPSDADPGRIPRRRREPAEALGPAAGPREDRRADERERRPVGDDADSKPRPRRPEQASLFGD